MVWAFLPIHLRSLNASFSLISLISLLPALETIVLSPLWGGLLDSTRRSREIILGAVLAQALEFALFPFLATPEQFVVAVSLAGVFTSSFIPVYSAMATWTSQQYGRAIGGFWAAASLGFGSATLLGGIVYELFDARHLFGLGAVYGFLGCFAVLLISRRAVALSGSVPKSRGYLGLLRQRNILTLCIISVLAIVSTSAFNSFFTLYLVDFLGGSRLMAGLAATGTTVLGAVAFRLVGPLNDRKGRKPVFLLGTVGYVAYFLATFLVTNALVVTILWVLPIYPFIQSSAAALASDYTSASDRGKGLGLLESAISLGGGLGPLAGGIIADAFELRAVILFSLATALVSAISSQLFLQEHARRAQVTL